MRRHLFPVAVAFTLLACASIAFGEDCLENTVKAGAKNGSMSRFTSIDKAVRAAKPGWEIVVGKGVWGETVLIDSKER